MQKNVRFLVALYNRQLTSVQIAELYKYSESTVRYHRIKNNIDSRSPNHGFIERVSKLKGTKQLLSSMQIKEAATHFGVSLTTVKALRKKLRVTRNRDLQNNQPFLKDTETLQKEEFLEKWQVCASTFYKARQWQSVKANPAD